MKPQTSKKPAADLILPKRTQEAAVPSTSGAMQKDRHCKKKTDGNETDSSTNSKRSHNYNIGTINVSTITNATKLNAFRTFIRTMELDIIFIQEIDNEQISLPVFNVIANVDNSRRGTAIALRDHIKFSHVEKSLDDRLVAVHVHDTTLCCVYAPSGTAYRAHRERFFNNTLAFYLRHRTEHVILAGDFNCVLRQCDGTGYNMSPSLQTAIQQLRLHDVWLKLRSRDAGHTYITANSSSRLDRIYVSGGLCEQLRNIDMHAVVFGHSVLICSPEKRLWISSCGGSIGPINDEIFADGSNGGYSFQTPYCQLRQAYDRFYQNPGVLSTINRIKGKMLALQRRFTQTVLHINEPILAGESLSVFQLGDQRRKRTAILQLEGEQGEIINDSRIIQDQIHRYFSDLYSEENREVEQRDDFRCDRIIPKNDAANEACMNEITTADIWTAVKTSASKKSPGPDGIPKEFYLRAFDVVHRELNLVLNEALTSNTPAKFVEGVIVLVKKKEPATR
ncbi:uncharacterized protein LOC134206463 [Armigeres subalbatus]|uniref:uncharacterized protein LOC134206463 n=1 Tax=Armigeres subalbatus TaxID=124917 RepID=UPI002ED298C9